MSSPRESNSSASGIRRLNPMAVDFTPAARTPSKRKASSSAKSSLSTASKSPPNMAHEQVSIDANQIFGRSASSSPVQADGPDDWEDLDELEDALLGQGVRRFQDVGLQMGGRPRRTLQTSPLSYRTSNRARSRPRRPAALLIQVDSPAKTSSICHGRVTGQLPYLSLCQQEAKSGKAEHGSYGVLPSDANRIMRATNATQKQNQKLWPRNRIPVELFELIAGHLARDDIKSMRLVSKEFEQKVCQSLFRTCVVPFNTELYDMIVESPGFKGKGKGKSSTTGDETDLWAWENAKEDKENKVYQGYGLRVFQGFGPYIRRFGMSFEIPESSLARPPGKRLLDPVDSYHGTYEWPSINYARFAKLNRLEETADETSRMKAAFSNLPIVSELGLSMRNGLGWLEGPDKSFRSALLEHPAAVFGSSHGSKDRLVRSARDVLSCLRQGVQKGSPGANFKEITLEQHTLDTPLAEINGLRGTRFADMDTWPTLDQDLVGTSQDFCPVRSSLDGFKVLCVNTDLAGAAKIGNLDLNPSDLKKDQKEWLLETEWAQRAFLESYILAVVDNPVVFSQVTTMNLATISSGLVPMISRAAFWDALPSLANVTVNISPDWRSVQKDEAGYAETKLQNPSEAVRGFYDLLQDQIAWREHIIRLTLGWADGGEMAQGMYARNANVLPAPISLLQESTAVNASNLVALPYVEHFTLSNCWITPPMLESFVNIHSSKALKKLTLDSVSLTTHPHPSTQAQQAQAAAAAIVNMQAQLQQNNPLVVGNQAPQLPPLMIHQPFAFAQHFQNQMQQMQQMFNPAAANPNGLHFAPFVPGQAWIPPAAGNANQQGGLGWPPPAPMHPLHHTMHANPTDWMYDHRHGCWSDLLNKISPGPTFTDYLPAPQPWEEQRSERQPTTLRTIELISCGYVRLDHNPSFDQTALLAGLDGRERSMSTWFRARHLALKPYMLDASNDKYLGHIAQWIPQREMDAMGYAWGLRVGWQDREKAEEAEFDGFHPGGTGRVSGVIEKGMPLMTQQYLQNLTPPGQTS